MRTLLPALVAFVLPSCGAVTGLRVPRDAGVDSAGADGAGVARDDGAGACVWRVREPVPLTVGDRDLTPGGIRVVRDRVWVPFQSRSSAAQGNFSQRLPLLCNTRF